MLVIISCILVTLMFHLGVTFKEQLDVSQSQGSQG